MDRKLGSILFTICLMLVFSYTAWEASSFNRLAQFFPYYLSIIAAFCCFISGLTQIIVLIKERKKGQSKDILQFLAPLRYIGWIFGYVLLIYLVGLMVATGIYLMLFLIIESKIKVWKSLATTVFVLIALSVFSGYLNLYWPSNIMGW